MGGNNSLTSTNHKDESELVTVGRVRRPTGIHGALLVEIYSGNPNRFSAGDYVFLNGTDYEIVEIVYPDPAGDGYWTKTIEYK